MLKHAGTCVRELFPETLFDPPISEGAIGKAGKIEIVRRRRDEHNQDVSFGARPFILCGLPIRRLPPGTLKYSRRNGRFFLEIVGHPDYGVPFGQDRLVLLWLATAAVRQKSPVVRFGSAAEILVEWGMQTNGSHYRRLHDAFRRVFASTIFFGTKDELREAEVWNCSRGHFFDQMRLWFNQQGEPHRRRERREHGHALAGILGGTPDSSDTGRYGSGAGAGKQSGLPRPVHMADVEVSPGQRHTAHPVVRSDGARKPVGRSGLCAGTQVPGKNSPVAGTGPTLLAGMPGDRGEQRSFSRIASGNCGTGKARCIIPSHGKRKEVKSLVGSLGGDRAWRQRVGCPPTGGHPEADVRTECRRRLTIHR